MVQKKGTSMENSSSEDPRALWDQRYTRVGVHGGDPLQDAPWLERWRGRLDSARRVLDLGCGAGYDSVWLSANRLSANRLSANRLSANRPDPAACALTAADFSFPALRLARAAAPCASFLQLDLRQGLPFAPSSFDVVVANLCLHYFPLSQTVDILAQVRACLRPGGTLLARFNSTRDANFGAEGCPPVEPNAFWVGGMYKRYFDRPALTELFADWKILALEELTVHRFGPAKVLWEVGAEK
jgi:SAM-dependent methyltransferase